MTKAYLPLPLLIALFLSIPADIIAAETVGSQILAKAGMTRGVCSVVGIADNLPIELAEAGEMLVHVRDPDPEAVYALRKTAAKAGLNIGRLTAETGSLSKLPFADNSVDIVVIAGKVPPLEDAIRVLRPEGVAFVRRKGNQRPRVRYGVPAPWETEDGGDWLIFRKPPMQGADDWSHWEKAADNNPVSNDQVIKAPYMTQFMADPLYIGIPSITTAAAGRTFLAIGHIAHHEREWGGLLRIIARNGYNGQILWERKLPEGYLVHRSAFIATRDAFYMLNGDHCLLLDPETGAEIGKLRIPDEDGHWKWMAIHQGKLYALLGEPDPKTETMKGGRSFGGWSWKDLSKGYYPDRVPFGFGDTLVCFDLQKNRVSWSHEEADGVQIDSRGIAIHENRVFLYCPDHYLKSIAADTGSPRWINDEDEVLNLIEMQGKSLISTPGFRTACLMVASPDALVIQGQTRMNVISISTADGRLLWKKKKITNNPNAIYVDDKFILGVGPRGSHVVVDPVTGKEEQDLKFVKRACTRLTASTDSLFCRGEGTLRVDRETNKVLVDGAARPACNDGAMPANGMLYLGPWQCDCNLSIIGNLARTSAGDFRFDHSAKGGDRTDQSDQSDQSHQVKTIAVDTNDWPTYRGDNQRSASSSSRLMGPINPKWTSAAPQPNVPSVPVAAGGLIFTAGDNGHVRALNAETGELKWKYLTPAPIKYPPTIAHNHAFVGCADGHVYALEAQTGRLLWRFRAAPVERHIMVYGRLSSTWPVNSGVLVHDGIAYFAAGIIDHDGTYVYAVDAKTGKLVWENNSSGHLNPELRKGVSVQGNLTLHGDHLILAGGNQVSPAHFELKTGKLVAPDLKDGNPKANNGRFVGAFGDVIIAGGRILHSAPQNVANKNFFEAMSNDRKFRFNLGGIPPAWSDHGLASVDTKFGRLAYANTDTVMNRITKGYTKTEARPARAWTRTLAKALEDEREWKWREDFGEKFEVLSIALTPNAVIAVIRNQEMFRSQRQWWVTGFREDNGRMMLRQELQSEPLPGGLLVDRDGRIVVSLINGDLAAFGK
jgi:outer membrane protein assembly factor BamB